jgi:hypothetical protein
MTAPVQTSSQYLLQMVVLTKGIVTDIGRKSLAFENTKPAKPMAFPLD